MVGRPNDTADDVAVLAGAGRIKDLDRHDVRAGIGRAGDADVVICTGGRDACQPGAVAVGIDVCARRGEYGIT